MELKIEGDSESTVSVSEAVFSAKFNEALIHQLVTSYLSGARQGTKAQKNRSEVRGGGRKPWRQKGTGRARAGTIRSPIWRGGGRAFAAKPRNYSKKVNRKMYRSGLRSIFSELVRQNLFVVVPSFDMDTPKTKVAVAKLNELNISDALVLSREVADNVYLATRNIPNIELCSVATLNPISLISHKKVLVTVDALQDIERILG